MAEHKPNYYAIIPAEVRYADIIPNAKLLYGEITALCNERGYCWASNRHFAKLYGKSDTTISLWLKSLQDAGFVEVKIDASKGNRRHIFLGGSLRKPKEGSLRKPEDINTKVINSKNNNTNVSNETLALPGIKNAPVLNSEPSAEKKETFGNNGVNFMLAALASECQVDRFTESDKWQRRHAHNLVRLYEKLGQVEFVARLHQLLENEFNFSRCNSIKFIYSQLSSMRSDRRAKATLSPMEKKLMERRLKNISLPSAS